MLKGVFTPMITAFDKAGNLDFKANGALIDRLIAGKVNGILFMGSIGEFFNLDMHEKKAFIDFAVKAVNKRVPVLVGTGGTNVNEVVELTQYSYKAGVDYAVVISPYYFKLDDASLYQYYAVVAKSSRLPLLIYNFPDRTGVDLSPTLVKMLALDFPNIVGIKDTVDNISHTRKLVAAIKPERPDFSILSGFDEYLVPNLLAGGDGLIGGLSNLVPTLFSGLYQAFLAEDFKVVTSAQARITQLMALYDVTNPFVLAIKEAVSNATKLCTPFMRRPVPDVNKEKIKRIEQLIAGIN